jgi:hypothetical protein
MQHKGGWSTHMRPFCRQLYRAMLSLIEYEHSYFCFGLRTKNLKVYLSFQKKGNDFFCREIPQWSTVS